MKSSPLMSSPTYRVPDDCIEEWVASIATNTGNPVARWNCPCGCEVFVVYSRQKNPQTGEDGVYFAGSMSFSPTPLGIHIDNVEDFDTLLADDRVDEKDRLLWALWLKAGLRETLLNAIGGDA